MMCRVKSLERIHGILSEHLLLIFKYSPFFHKREGEGSSRWPRAAPYLALAENPGIRQKGKGEAVRSVISAGNSRSMSFSEEGKENQVISVHR
jgi:hypothetical protein